MEQNRRQFFRLEYPEKMGPKFTSGGVSYIVINISEQGLKLGTKKGTTYKPGGSIAGSLNFPNGESFLVFGTIKRVSEDSISIQLKKPIPLRVIMEEQRRIILLFPKQA